MPTAAMASRPSTPMSLGVYAADADRAVATELLRRLAGMYGPGAASVAPAPRMGWDDGTPHPAWEHLLVVLSPEALDSARFVDGAIHLAALLTRAGGRPAVVAVVARACALPAELAADAVVPYAETSHGDEDQAFARLLDAIHTTTPHAPRAPTATTPKDAAAAATDGHPRVFVSHRSLDDAVGHRLVTYLRAQGLDVWYDSAGGLQPGDVWWDRIVRELSTRPVFVVLLSRAALASGWVRDELRLAWQQKNAPGGKVIVPVLLEACEVPPYVAMVQLVSLLPGRDDEATAFARLLDAILAGETRLVAVATGPRVAAGPPFDDTLLPLPARFVGREAELAWVEERLRVGGAVGITALGGMGGIGKTTLAAVAVRELAWEGAFPDGIVVQSCEGKTDGATDARALLRTVLERFEPEHRAIAKEEEEQAPARLAALARELLHGMRALVLLDNVEPGLDVAALVGPLQAAGATMLLTARQRLPEEVVGVDGALRLDLLAPSEALDLFALAYGRTTPADLTPAERAAAERIVQTLERHTLALRLAGAYAAALERPLGVLADELARDPLDIPRSEEQRAVEKVLGRSIAALPAAAQQLFAALAAFPTAEFGRQAALALTEALGLAEPKGALELLVRRALLDASVNAGMPAEKSDHERLRLHPLLLADARRRFTRWAAGERDTARDALVQWYAAYANATPYLALDPDEANIVGALERAVTGGDDRAVAAICHGMARFWRDTGRAQAGLQYLPVGIAAAERVAHASGAWEDRLQAATIASYYADFLRIIGRLAEAETTYRRDLKLRRKVGERRGEATALTGLGGVAYARGQMDTAQAYYKQALAISREVDEWGDEAAALTGLGLVARARGQMDLAQAYYERALAIYREGGNRGGEAQTLTTLGRLARDRGQWHVAEETFQRALALDKDRDAPQAVAVDLADLTDVLRAQGRTDEAAVYQEQATAIEAALSAEEADEAAQDDR